MTPVCLKQKVENPLFSSTSLPFHRWECWCPQKRVLCSLQAFPCDSHFAFLEAGECEGRKGRRLKLWCYISTTEGGPELLWLWGHQTELCVWGRAISPQGHIQFSPSSGARPGTGHVSICSLATPVTLDMSGGIDWWIPRDYQRPDILKQLFEEYKVLRFPSFSPIPLLSLNLPCTTLWYICSAQR